MATAIGHARLGAVAARERDRDHAGDHRDGGHEDRPEPDRARPRAARRASTCPRSRSWFVNSTSRMPFFVTSPISMMKPIIAIIDMYWRGDEQPADAADDRERQRHHDRERVDEALELRGEDDVDEDDAEQERDARTPCRPCPARAPAPRSRGSPTPAAPSRRSRSGTRSRRRARSSCRSASSVTCRICACRSICDGPERRPDVGDGAQLDELARRRRAPGSRRSRRDRRAPPAGAAP